MSYKNKAYSNKTRTSSGKDYEGYFYHLNQEQRQDRLISEWLKTIPGVKRRPARNQRSNAK